MSARDERVEDLGEILERALQRGRAKALDYAGELTHHATPEEPVLFLCRSGIRSHHAAEVATRAGYQRAFNVLEGFEGDIDESRRRGALGGWRAAGLPWEQS